jgi:hypothetical protein
MRLVVVHAIAVNIFPAFAAAFATMYVYVVVCADTVIFGDAVMELVVVGNTLKMQLNLQRDNGAML